MNSLIKKNRKSLLLIYVAMITITALQTICYAQNPIIQTKYTADPAPMVHNDTVCLLYTSPSPRDRTRSRMPSSA